MTGRAALARCAAALVAGGALLIAGCAGGSGMVCEDRSRYAGAATTPPLRIPDDLSIPDESNALVIPPASADASEPSGDDADCLEAPPPFFQGDSSSPGDT